MEMEMNPNQLRSFFKIITSNHSHDKLRVPPNFKKNMSLEMFDRAILRDSSGDHWPVKLQRRLQDIYLEDGWPQFMRDHTLGNDEFLVFTYVGDVHFIVQIFEKSGCERVHASTGSKHLESAVAPCGERKRGRPWKVKPNSGSSSSNKKRRSSEKVHSNSSQFCLKSPGDKKRGRSKKVQPDSSHFCPKSPTGKKRGRPKKVQPESSHCCPKSPKSVPERTGQEPKRHLGRILHALEISTEALKMAETFSSEHPHFLACVRVHKKTKDLLLRIPISFSDPHFPRSIAVFTLRNSVKETWQVKALYQRGYHVFSAGWTSFVRDNKIKHGDICVFELVGKNLLQVHVFPVQAT